MMKFRLASTLGWFLASAFLALSVFGFTVSAVKRDPDAALMAASLAMLGLGILALTIRTTDTLILHAGGLTVQQGKRTIDISWDALQDVKLSPGKNVSFIRFRWRNPDSARTVEATISAGMSLALHVEGVVKRYWRHPESRSRLSPVGTPAPPTQ